MISPHTLITTPAIKMLMSLGSLLIKKILILSMSPFKISDNVIFLAPKNNDVKDRTIKISIKIKYLFFILIFPHLTNLTYFINTSKMIFVIINDNSIIIFKIKLVYILMILNITFYLKGDIINENFFNFQNCTNMYLSCSYCWMYIIKQKC
ncbi:hypothetical protein RATSFB_0987 [Candidatus Arthromitus sp. SFB-rat-Yit]|nr:hypothetical protein RATSFB_0987 [Candidatus Arthromitus sp. SFB-rat-Yit]